MKIGRKEAGVLVDEHRPANSWTTKVKRDVLRKISDFLEVRLGSLRERAAWYPGLFLWAEVLFLEMPLRLGRARACIGLHLRLGHRDRREGRS